jgi:hypothetical protein
MRVFRLGVVVSSMGCSLLFNTDDMMAIVRTVPDAASETSDGGTDSGTAVDARTDAPDVPRVPTGLTVDSVSDPTKIFVERTGSFRLTFAGAKGWQLDSWTDEIGSPGVVFAGGPKGTFSPFRVPYAGKMCEVNAGPHVSPAVVTLDIVTPAMVRISSTFWCGPLAGKPKLAVGATYTIWPSGRIAVASSVLSEGAAQPVDNPPVMLSEVSLPADKVWDNSARSDSDGVAFRLSGSRTAFAVFDADVHHPEDTLAAVQPSSAIYTLTGFSAIPTDWVNRTRQLLIAPGLDASALAGRVQEQVNFDSQDRLNVDGYYGFYWGSFEFTRQGPGTIGFSLPGTTPRYELGVVVQNWKDDKFKILRDGVEIASSVTPITADCVSAYDAGKSALYFQDQKNIPRKTAVTRYEVQPL